MNKSDITVEREKTELNVAGSSGPISVSFGGGQNNNGSNYSKTTIGSGVSGSFIFGGNVDANLEVIKQENND